MRRAQRGMALLVVLWATALLTIMLTAFAVSMRTEGLQSRYQFDQARARYAAEAGLARATYGLTERDPRQRWFDDGRSYAFRFDAARVTVRVNSQAGLVDINTASPQVLTGLFKAVGLDAGRAEALSEAVQDWRDSDNDTRPNGAERAQYRDAGRDYGPRNGPFLTLEELQMVLGMTPRLYARLAPVITLWSGRMQPAPASAPLLALESLPGVDPGEAQRYVKLRQQRTDGEQPLPQLPGAGIAVGGTLGDNDAVHVEATLPNGTRAALDAVISLDGNGANGSPYRVLHWQWITPGAAGAGAASGSAGTGRAG